MNSTGIISLIFVAIVIVLKINGDLTTDTVIICMILLTMMNTGYTIKKIEGGK